MRHDHQNPLPLFPDSRHTYASVLEKITPKEAQRRLDLMREAEQRGGNYIQRGINKDKLAKYTRAMKKGAWLPNGSTVGIDEEGIPIDGQHRYRACVQSGEAFTTLVAYGVSRSSIVTIDVGKGRTSGDIFKMTGHSYSSNKPAMINQILRIQSGRVGTRRSGLTTAEQLEWMAEGSREADMEESLKKTSGCKRFIEPSASASLHYIFAKKDRVKADEFFRRLDDGIWDGATASDPIYMLREQIIRSKAQTLKKDVIKPDEIISRCIRAWNAYRQGKTLRTIQGAYIDASGVLRFPTIE